MEDIKVENEEMKITEPCEIKSEDNGFQILEPPTGSFDGSEPANAFACPAVLSTFAALPTAPRRRAQKRPREQPSELVRLLIEALRNPPAPPSRSDEEIFLLSLAPSLQRVPPQRKEYVKFQIHKLIYENSTSVLNLEPKE
ncbi:uncharacterized protein [Paramisgurnus dabryanus]|uniref:uncharacterized protein isoform X2 n=1 Tax=Paramisgurnus dabryanus TaxID=90735 RepID=UPI0031F39C74